MKRSKNLFFRILRIIFFPFVYIYERILERHLYVMEKRIRREFEVGLSHELKTPLTSIYAYAELLLDHLEDEEDKRSVKVIYVKSQELLRLIDNMITISIIDFNPYSIEYSEVDMSQIAVRCINRFKNLYPDFKSYNLKTYIEPDLLVRGEDKLLFTIAYELLSNAYLYRQKNNVADISMELSHSEGEAVLRIKDNGQGISVKDRQKVFDQFFRIEDRDRATTPGLGIGLSLVKKIVTVLNGSIELKSKVDKGTEIQVRLPLVRMKIPG